MVLAAQEHDNGWWDWEIKRRSTTKDCRRIISQQHQTSRGKVWLDFYRHGIHRLAEQDPYAGYIVSLHSDGLLTQGRGLLPLHAELRGYPDVKEFSTEQESYRAELMEKLKSSRHTAATYPVSNCGRTLN